MNTIEHYRDESGCVPFQIWLDSFKDKQAKGKPCREGVWELREDFGPGYRVYYARNGKTVVLLLCGGDKRSQDADISRAVKCWKDYQRRNAT